MLKKGRREGGGGILFDKIDNEKNYQNTKTKKKQQGGKGTLIVYQKRYIYTYIYIYIYIYIHI